MLCEGGIDWHFTRVTPSGKRCQSSPLLVSALSIHSFSITALRVVGVLERISGVLPRQVTRGQPPGDNHWHCTFTGNLGSSA